MLCIVEYSSFPFSWHCYLSYRVICLNVPLPANWIGTINSCYSRSLADGQVPEGVGTSQMQEMRLKNDWKEGWMCDVLLLGLCQYFGTADFGRK